MHSAQVRSFFVDYEPVCDGCGHGMGLHAERADVECIACVERGDGVDCASYASSGVAPPWRASPGRTGVRMLRRLAEGFH